MNTNAGILNHLPRPTNALAVLFPDHLGRAELLVERRLSEDTVTACAASKLHRNRSRSAAFSCNKS
jgi:hypothetical protein